MKKILTGFIIAAFTLGSSSAFAASDAVKNLLDDQKKQEKVEYENRKDELKTQYQGDDLKNQLMKAESDYKAKVKHLDELKDQPDTQQ